MRLLDTRTLELKDFVRQNIPKYAILSHTWKEGKEASFQELQYPSSQSLRTTAKSGFAKIRRVCDMALADRLDYAWVDTCCIDKSNSVELQEAINSMFRWYRDAAKCYVYLADVSTPTLNASDKASWEPAFQRSEWFTRGWTIQELIAPASVEFFSKEHVRLEDKESLKQQIHHITRIPLRVLQGSPLSGFSIPERLAWAEKRQTTRKEDKAYSLLGIFNIHMPLIYGEGEENAFRRLREEINKAARDKLLPTIQASTDRDAKCLEDLRVTDPRHDKTRIEQTKGGLLKDSYRWILDNADFRRWCDDENSRLLWIKGDPGKGKTMLLCGIIDEFSSSTRLADPKANSLLSYFFCQATDSRINNATAVLRGLIYLLVKQQPLLISHVRERYKDAGKALFEDVNAWIALSDIFTNTLQDQKPLNLGWLQRTSLA